MPARRCAIGCESWPVNDIFITCSYCGERTRLVGNIDPTISFDEAKSIKLHELFDLYYEKRCLKKGIPSDGPLADDPMDVDTLGKMP